MRLLKKHPRPLPLPHGFSMIELLVVVALLGIVSVMAAPSFTSVFERYRIAATRDELIGSLELARIQAISQGQSVVLKRLNCTPVGWSCGWQVVSTNGTTLQTVYVPSGIAVTIHDLDNPRNQSQFQVNRFGFFTSWNGIIITPSNLNPTNGTAICISSAARFRVAPGVKKCSP